MENNNQDLLCCVRDMFGGCAGTPSSPNLRYMFAAVLAKQDDGCFALKVDIPIPSAIDVDSLLCGGATETVSVKDEALTQVYLAGQKNPIAVCIEGGEPIELGGFDTLYDGVPAHIEIIRDEDTGAIDRYVAHYKDGSGTVVDPADPTKFSTAPTPPEIDAVISEWQAVCVDGVQWYVADKYTIDNVDGTPTYVGKIYKQGSTGTPTDTAPTGTIVEGVCALRGNFVPHVNGCIKRQTGTPTSCDVTSSTFEFLSSDFVDLTVESNDGNGNYTMRQEFTNHTAVVRWIDAVNTIKLINRRTVEDVDSGVITFNFHPDSIGTVTQITPTTVRYTVHLEPGVTDTPVALSPPCVDPVTNATYAASAATLRGIFDAQTIGTPQPNAADVTFTVTRYQPLGNGEALHIPVKQVLRQLEDGTMEEKFYTPGDINTEIVFNQVTDTYENVCKDDVIKVDYEPICVFDNTGTLLDKGTYFWGYGKRVDGTGVNLGYFQRSIGGGYFKVEFPSDLVIDDCPDDPIPVANGGAKEWTGIGGSGSPVAYQNIPANTRSFTVTAHSGRFDISFDNGATWALTDVNGGKTWGSDDLRFYNAIDVRVRGTTATAKIKIHWMTV